MDRNEIRNLLPSKSIIMFEDIVTGRSLGASNHIKMISDMFIDIAQNNNEDEAKDRVARVSDYFKETRGKSSYAIVSALTIIEDNIKHYDLDYLQCVKKGIDQYYEEANQNIELVLAYSKKILSDASCVMIYDYSSTVEKAIVQAPNKMKIIIPESRSINGGYPFVKKIVEAGHNVHFIPDAAMLTVLKEVDMVFIGAETFYCDGTAFNTAGSDILAELCHVYHIPYYVVTPLIKADIRSIYGQYKEVIAKDLGTTMARDWPSGLATKVDFNTIELVGIPPNLISNYICEKGILRPNELFYFVYRENKDAK